MSTDQEKHLERLTLVVAALNSLERLQRLTDDTGQRARIAAIGTAVGELLRPAAGLVAQVQP